MKTRLIPTALLMAATVVALPSCFEEEATAKPAEQQQQPEPPAPVEPAKPAEPTAEIIAPVVLAQLADFGFITPGEISMQISPNPDNSFTVIITLPVTIKENLFTSQPAPEHFNEERKAINESAAAAMLPASGYLVQVGAPTDIITDADRAATPLPENLQNLANELKELAESAVYVVSTPAGTAVNINGSLKATLNNGNWEISDVVVDTSALLEISHATPESALPQGAAVMTADFEQNRKNAINEKIAAFNSEAQPYIKGREDAARARMVEAQARREEETRKAEEQAQAAAAETEAWKNHCIANIAKGKLFSGEWTRDTQFGTISLQIDDVGQFEDSIQFIGKLYDTKLPEASMDVDGRCTFTKNEDGTSSLYINIYDGQYDPDQPTAEVFDAKDGMLLLSLTAEGKLTGTMTCEAWKDTPEKAFKISIAPAEPKKPAKRRW